MSIVILMLLAVLVPGAVSPVATVTQFAKLDVLLV